MIATLLATLAAAAAPGAPDPTIEVSARSGMVCVTRPVLAVSGKVGGGFERACSTRGDAFAPSEATIVDTREDAPQDRRAG